MIDNNFKKKVVGVDIRIDRTALGVVNIRGEILARNEFVTTDYPNISEFVTEIRSVGISVPSGNFITGCMENSPNFPWKGIVPLAAMLRDRLGLAVAVDNNANVIAMAEHAFGAAHGMKDFILVNLGSGTGSCFFSKGHIHRGIHGFSGERSAADCPRSAG